VVDGWTLSAAAEAAGVSVRCASKWAGRYRAEGESGLFDRSSAPVNRTSADWVAVIVGLRGLRMTAAEIAETLQMPLSTVSVVLRRAGMGKLGRIGLEQLVRYERSLRAFGPGRAWRVPADWPGAVRHEGGASVDRAPVWNV
jgi:hypothetical protein